MTRGADQRSKQRAVLELGRIGSPAAVRALRAFEAWAEQEQASEHSFRFGRADCGIDHLQGCDLKPAASHLDRAGTEWVVFQGSRYGGCGLFLTRALAAGGWSSPVLLGLPWTADRPWVSCLDGETELSFRREGDAFVLAVNDELARIDLREQVRDSDGDGLTDEVERALHTDPLRTDSDSDGTDDRKDGNPLTSGAGPRDEGAEIRQAVFILIFGTSSSEDTIVAATPAGTGAQEYRGYRGRVLGATELRPGFVNFGIEVEEATRTEARVRFWDFVSGLAGTRRLAQLRKIEGKWVVVDLERISIS